MRQLLVLLVLVVSCFGMAFGAAGMLTALPAPAVGGTCGPSTASETALQALVDPSSIGAGPEPRAGTAAHQQWQAFVDQCQTLADRRGLASAAIFIGSLAVGAICLLALLRRRPAPPDQDSPVDAGAGGLGTPFGTVSAAPAGMAGTSPSTSPVALGLPPATVLERPVMPDGDGTRPHGGPSDVPPPPLA